MKTYMHNLLPQCSLHTKTSIKWLIRWSGVSRKHIQSTDLLIMGNSIVLFYLDVCYPQQCINLVYLSFMLKEIWDIFKSTSVPPSFIVETEENVYRIMNELALHLVYLIQIWNMHLLASLVLLDIKLWCFNSQGLRSLSSSSTHLTIIYTMQETLCVF